MIRRRPGSSGAFLSRPAANVVAGATCHNRIQEARKLQPHPALIDDSLRRQDRGSHRIHAVTACRHPRANIHSGLPSRIGLNHASPLASSREFSIVCRFRTNVGICSGMPGKVRVCLVYGRLVPVLDRIGALAGDQLDKTGTTCRSLENSVGSGDDCLAQAAWPLLAIRQFQAGSVISLDPGRRRSAPLSIC